MRILLLGSLFADSFTRNIQVTLEAMGHQVITASAWRPPNWLPYPLRMLALRASQRSWLGIDGGFLRRSVLQFDPQLVLNGYWDVAPSLIAELRRAHRVPIVAWFPDHPVNLRRQYLLAASYDALFIKARYLVELVSQQLGKVAFYLPECCNPLWHHRVELTQSDSAFYGCDITTAGNLYVYRALLMELLADYNIKIWGPSCPPWLASPVRRFHQNRFVAELEKAKAFNAAKIVLNTLHPAEIGSVNARLFEAAGCGAFQISEHRDAIIEFFEPDTEVVTFHSQAELKEKIDYYLRHEEQRRAIADRSLARAHREHTYELRLRHLLSVVAELPRRP